MQATKFRVGWKVILVIIALPAPLLNSYKGVPSSELKILIIVPLIEAEAINVPYELIVRAPISDSWAYILFSILLSTT